jgi:EAL and modified HD-GYP domain-containing signal transduction protein
MLLLGPWEFRQWASLLIVAGMGSDKPDELVIQGLIRGRFCELLAPRFGMALQSQELFFMGLFSLVDAILGRPLAEILQDLPISAEIKDALLGRRNRPRTVFDYAVAYERGDWEKLMEIARSLKLDESSVPRLYKAAIRWAEESFEQVRPDG